MGAFEFRSVFASADIVGAAFLEVQNDQLIAVSETTGDVVVYELSEQQIPALDAMTDGIGETFLPSDGAILDDGTLWTWTHLDGRIAIVSDGSRVAQIDNQPMKISGVLQLSSGQYVIGVHDRDQLMLIDGSQYTGAFNEVASFVDDAKTTVAGLSDMISVEVGTAEYLVAASYVESGLTSFRVSEQGFEVTDTIGAKDALWVSGIAKLDSCVVDGESYVLALSADANTLVSLRLNDLGVFFPVDQIWDNRDTRFEGAVDFDVFTWGDRQFVVVGGQDLGLSLIEVLPTGVMFHHQSIAQSVDWNIGPITQLEATVIGDEAQVFVTGSQGAGIAQINLDLSRLGGVISGGASDDTLTGGWKDDVLIGGAGNDHLFGKAGDDILLDGEGSDILEGEDGADIFVFRSDGQSDKIKGFELGLDRIHVGDWGRIYDVSALEFESTSWGARISWGDEVIEVYTKNRRPIELSDWSADDFIF